MVASWLSVTVGVKKVEEVAGLGFRISLRLDRLE